MGQRRLHPTNIFERLPNPTTKEKLASNVGENLSQISFIISCSVVNIPAKHGFVTTVGLWVKKLICCCYNETVTLATNMLFSCANCFSSQQNNFVVSFLSNNFTLAEPFFLFFPIVRL